MLGGKFFALAFALVYWVVGPAVFAQCGGGPPVNRNAIFHVVNVPLQPTYHHNLSTAQIQSLGYNVKLASRNLEEPGLTTAEQSLETNAQYGALENTRTHRFCVWAESVDVEFSYTKMDVYVSSQYPESSCPYRVILEHENQHVAINQGVLRKYVNLMKQAIRKDRTIPTKTRPLSAASFKEGQDIISARIARIIQPLYQHYKREVLGANRKIDTMRNYRRIQAKCKGW